MVDTIKIDVDNFGLIDSGEFEISQIGIIKGMEGHGRADFNKLLFAFLITVSSEGLYAANNMVKNEFFNTIDKSSNPSFRFMQEYNDFINNDWEEYNISPKYLNLKYEEYKKILKKHNVQIDHSRIKEVLGLFNEYKRYRSPIFQRMLDVEFKNYSFEKYSDYEVNIYLDDYLHFIKNENGETKYGMSYETPILPGNVLYLGPRPIMDFDNNPPHITMRNSTAT